MSTTVLEQQVWVVLPQRVKAGSATGSGRRAPATGNFRQRHPLIVSVLFVVVLILLLSVNG